MESFKILAVFVVLIAGSQGYVQELIVHMSVHQNSSYHLFKESVPNVPAGILDGAQAFCTRGFWIAYSGVNYEGEAAILHGANADLNCVDEAFPYRSFRFGGNLNTEDDGLSVYPQEGFQGTEVIVTGPALAILSGKSIVYTKASSWTIFEGQNFFGATTCAQVEAVNLELELQGNANVTESLGLGLVGSVIKGCTRDEIEISLAQYRAMNRS